MRTDFTRQYIVIHTFSHISFLKSLAPPRPFFSFRRQVSLRWPQYLKTCSLWNKTRQDRLTCMCLKSDFSEGMCNQRVHMIDTTLLHYYMIFCNKKTRIPINLKLYILLDGIGWDCRLSKRSVRKGFPIR